MGTSGWGTYICDGYAVVGYVRLRWVCQGGGTYICVGYGRVWVLKSVMGMRGWVLMSMMGMPGLEYLRL